MEVENHALPPFIPGQDPGGVKIGEGVGFEMYLAAAQNAHQLSQLVLSFPGIFQGQIVDEGLEQLQLGPDSFGRKTHTAASFPCLIPYYHFGR